jgi:hypothetical protein
MGRPPPFSPPGLGLSLSNGRNQMPETGRVHESTCDNHLDNKETSSGPPRLPPLPKMGPSILSAINNANWTTTSESEPRLTLVTATSFTNHPKLREKEFESINEWSWNKSETIQTVAARQKVRVRTTVRRKSEQPQLFMPGLKEA